MEDNRMTHIEDTEVLGEIDDINYFGFETSVVNDDPFAKVNFNNLSTKMKRKAQRLAKKYEGIDGISTKYIDPETLDGYSLYDIVNPPYDLDTLAGLYDSSAVHNASVAQEL